VSYCPYCGSQLWTADSGEDRCPSGAAFSRVATRQLAELPTGSTPNKHELLSPSHWYCPSCGCGMSDTDDGPICTRCGRRLVESLLHQLVELNPHEPYPPKPLPVGRLTAYWITRAGAGHPIGVTGFSLEDALRIAERAGYSIPDGFVVIDNVRIEDLDPRHVVPRVGPIDVRGVWYPLSGIDKSK